MASLSLICEGQFTYQPPTKNSNNTLAKTTNSLVNTKDSLGRINLNRMQHALATPTFEMPVGLTREQKRAFILSKANS